MKKLDRDEATRLVEDTVASLPARFNGCAMCAIAAGEHDADLVLTKSEHGLVVLDRFASTRGHLLVILPQHHEHLAHLEWAAYAALQKLAWEAAQTLEAVLKPRRTFVAALGSSAPLAKSFPHLHLHVVPLYDDSEASKPANVFSWASGVWVYERGEAQKLGRELIEKSSWRCL